MNRIFRSLPYFTPWILLLFFAQGLFYRIEFKLPPTEKQPMEILMESDEEFFSEEGSYSFRKGALYRLASLHEFLNELEADEIPQDGYPEITFERLSRIVFGQKLVVFVTIFLCVLALSSFISWYFKAWYGIRLNKILHWLGLVVVFLSLGNPLPHVVTSNFAIFLASLYSLLFVYLIFSYRAVHAGKKESINFEVLKHTSELDEEGKKPTQKMEWNFMTSLKVGYHFLVILLVGLLVGNFFYTPLFLLQKHYSYEFGILLVVLLGLLSIFYIRNYAVISEDKEFSRFQNILSSFAYLQYRFIRNFALGIFSLVLVVFFVTVLFSLLFMNSDVLKSPQLGIIEKSAEF